MKLSRLALAFSAATMPLAAAPLLAQEDGAAKPKETALISYDDALNCTALMAIFVVAFEDDADKGIAKILDDQLTRWSVVAVTRGEATGKEADKDIEIATENLAASLDSFGDDEAALEKMFEASAKKCSELEEANQTEFDAVDVEAINDIQDAEELTI